MALSQRQTFYFADLSERGTCLCSAFTLFSGNVVLLTTMLLWQGASANWNRYACSDLLPRLRLGYLHAILFSDAAFLLSETADNSALRARLFQSFIKKQ